MRGVESGRKATATDHRLGGWPDSLPLRAASETVPIEPAQPPLFRFLVAVPQEPAR